ncbi:MAG: uroporphyrinogen-III C-methyltransferase [Chloroflexota bacterium]|jgi:uroporphyrinogen III methyltransferase/synthase|nr:uroporphyrinogen-III C-methyltransferase [Chloroflexota bacterium]MDP6757935.1 uroporphyrinogen-III C-methyltransferase [Chloroflexota bacterium]
MPEAQPGKVYLVGAGPGDPGLLTLRGHDLLRAVDIVLPDSLVSEEVIALIDGPEIIPVGKRYGSNSVSQGDINALLVRLAQEGNTICRLKGGDPMVFGRIGEELRVLNDAGIAYEIVPGISSATAAPAYAGIPLTMRGVSAGFVCVTGRRASTAGSPDIDWPSLAGLNQTLVILMVATRIGDITDSLLEAGMDANAPVALIEQATLPGQRTLVATVADIAARAGEAGVMTPATLVVGPAVAESHHFAWRSALPLTGRRVLLTTPPPVTAGLGALLCAAGASVISRPAIEVEPLADADQFAANLEEGLEATDWAVFASRSAVDAVFNALESRGRDARALGGIHVAALGTGTARALEACGINPDLVPEEFVSESVVDGLLAELDADDRVLVFGAEGGRTVIRDRLNNAGFEVTRLDAYRTVPTAPTMPEVQSALDEVPDWAVFTSPSAVHSLFDSLDRAGLALPETTRVAVIGPITAAAAAERDLAVAAVAEPHTYAGLVSALVAESEPRDA